MKKNILLIDGENFVHSLVLALKKFNIIKQRSSLHKIDLSILFSDIGLQDAEIHYYMTRINLPESTHQLFPAANRMRLWNGKWIPHLANQNVKIVRAGLLKIRDGKKCGHCGKSTEILLEKGVDVKIGVDLTLSRGTIYLFSSDSDLIPAVAAAVKANTKVVYVCVEGQINYAMCKSASKAIIIPKNKVVKAYKSAKSRKHWK